MDTVILFRWLAAAGKSASDEAWELLRQTPELRDATDGIGETALFKAAYCGSEGVIQMLLDAGAATDRVNEYGQTALHLAVRGGHAGLVPILTGAGIPVNAVDGMGRSCLFYAARPQVVATLQSCGANFRLIDAGGKQVLHAAVEAGYSDCVAVVRALLQAGALATAKDRDGNTPLHLDITGAALWLLLGAGARVNMLNTAGQSALELAVRRGAEAAVRILLNAGAAVAQGHIREALDHIANPDWRVRRRIQGLLEPHMVRVAAPEPPPEPEPEKNAPDTISLLPPRVLNARKNRTKR